MKKTLGIILMGIIGIQNINAEEVKNIDRGNIIYSDLIGRWKDYPDGIRIEVEYQSGNCYAVVNRVKGSWESLTGFSVGHSFISEEGLKNLVPESVADAYVVDKCRYRSDKLEIKSLKISDLND